MTTSTPPSISPDSPAPSSSSTGKKWAIGCGIGCLAIVLLLGIGCGVSGWLAYSHYKNVSVKQLVEFEEQGFGVQRGLVKQVGGQVSGPTVFAAFVVQYDAESDGDVAIVAQVAQISGSVAGNAYFRGKVLTVQPDGVVEGDLDVDAQVVQVLGTVKGLITGDADVLDDQSSRE